MPLHVAARALDAARAPLLRVAVARVPFAARLLGGRDLRLAVYATLGTAAAAALCLFAPVALFFWGPLALGVPHLLADARYLTLPRYSGVSLRMRDGSVLVLMLASLIWPQSGVGFAAIGAAVLVGPWTQGTRWRTGLVLMGATLLLAVSAHAPLVALYILVHAHNVVALLMLATVFGRPRLALGLLFGCATLVALVLFGAVDAIVHVSAGLSLSDMAAYVLPPEAFDAWGTRMCERILLVFLLMQSVHYAVWLRLIPESARSRKGVRGFASSLVAVQQDMGAVVVYAAVGLTLGLLAYGAMQGANEARTIYLHIAGFHAYFELAVFARWLCGTTTRKSA